MKFLKYKMWDYSIASFFFWIYFVQILIFLSIFYKIDAFDKSGTIKIRFKFINSYENYLY